MDLLLGIRWVNIDFLAPGDVVDLRGDPYAEKCHYPIDFYITVEYNQEHESDSESDPELPVRLTAHWPDKPDTHFFFPSGHEVKVVPSDWAAAA